jgi:hypothetical protein
MGAIKAWTTGLKNGRYGWRGHVPVTGKAIPKKYEFRLPELPIGWQWEWMTDSHERRNPNRVTGFLRRGVEFHFEVSCTPEIWNEGTHTQDPLRIIENAVVTFVNNVHEGKIMPCNCDHMEPTQRERLLQDAARFQVVVRQRLEMSVPAWLKREAKNIYAKDERNATELCAIITALSKEERRKLLYSDATDAKMRDVASWWEMHEKVDKARKAKERKEAKVKKEKAEALAALTPRQRKLLGV